MNIIKIKYLHYGMMLNHMSFDIGITAASIPQEEFASVVAWIESLPLALLGDFVRGGMSEAGRQMDGMFKSRLAENFG